MTSLRFVGDTPLWLGIVLALVVGVLSWLYYNREGFELPGRLRVILPLLRSTAFALGILILTGPVLHHKKTIGELGKVKVFIDLSQSMTQRDKHMSLARKLRIASQLGWLVDRVPEFPDLDTIEFISRQRKILLRTMQRDSEFDGAEIPVEDSERLTQPVNNFIKALESTDSLSNENQNQLVEKVLTPLKEMAAKGDKLQVSRIRSILTECARLEQNVLGKIDADLLLKAGKSNGSMATAIDLFDEAPRWRRIVMGLEEELPNQDFSLLQKLRSRHNVELFLMDRPDSETTRLDAQQPLPTDGLALQDTFVESTDLGRRIVNSLDASASDSSQQERTGKNQTAVILLSDGRHNLGPSPVRLARELAAQGYSFFNVGIGAISPAVDLAVLKVEHPKLAFKKDEIRGALTIRDAMTPGKPFVAQIKMDEKVLWQKQFIAQDIQQRQIDFQFRVDELIDELGTTKSNVENHIRQLALTASITPLSEESETGNNSQPIRLSVITEGYKVLILDGRSRWETRFIRNAFERDEQWEVRTVLAGKSTSDPTLPRGDEPGKFPTTRQQLFEFDLIVWGEVEPELLDEKEFKWVSEFVENRGGGIVFIDGLRGKLRKLDSTAVGDLVPVLDVKPTVAKLPSKLELAPPGVDLPALALNIDKLDNQKFWTELPPPRTFVPIEPTADATVLANVSVGEEEFPAIVTRNYGAGRVLYLSFDETWRWRYKSADTWHQRAWQQLAKFAMPQPFAVSDEFVSIDTGPASYESDEQPIVRVKLRDLDGQPNPDAIVDALVWKNGKVVSSVNLESDSQVPGLYRNQLEDLGPGDYEVSIRASGYQESALASRGRFLVLAAESGEMSETSVNEELLEQMANESQGKYLAEEEMSRLSELLEPFSNGRVVESDTILWQSYWWFSAMILLLTIEWILRKRAGLL